MKLIDIFPKINHTLDPGLVMEKGVCTDLDINKHIKYLGINDEITGVDDVSFFFAGNVEEIDSDTNMFNSPGQGFNSLVFTTNLKKFSPYMCMCRGFKHVYIIDAKTEEVVFHSEKFYCDDPYEFLSNDDIWDYFGSDYEDDPISTIKDPLYFDPDVDLED